VSTEIESRLEDLEVKASFTEDLLDHLNATVAQQQRQIELLVQELRRLRELLPEASTPVQRNLREEIPPHY
jgi:SlyX protein